jgi:hypothetical protein
MKNYLAIGLLVLCGCCSTVCKSLPTGEIADMYASYIDDWKQEAKAAFDEAETKVFVVNPKPKPDINDGTNPDPAKCICKGTGIIVQGDGHKTACPFHSKSQK